MKGDLISKITAALWGIVAALMVAILGAIMACSLMGSDRDSTDTKAVRSGMKLYTDALTGCQYLSAGGGLTPRIDSDGEPVCNEDVLK